MKNKVRRRHVFLFSILVMLAMIGIFLYFLIPMVEHSVEENKKKAVVTTRVTTATTEATTKTTVTKNWYDYNGIAHALGDINGMVYTNSKEGFEASIKKGFHIFEVDLLQTTDHVLVGKHKWGKVLSDPLSKGSKYRVSYSEFKNTKIYGKYTPISFREILDYMERYPDIYVMTDTKDENYAAAVSDAKLIVQTAKDAGKEYLLDRLIIQIYSQNMLGGIKKVYPFQHVLYTTYKQDDVAFSEMIRFCKSNGIEAVTVPVDDVNDYRMKLLSDAKLKSYTHTINSVYETKEYMKLGVYGIYSDMLTSDEIEQASLDVESSKAIKTYTDTLKE